MRNYREEWAEGEIEASALLDAIDELRADRATLQQMAYCLKDHLEAAEKERDELMAALQRIADGQEMSGLFTFADVVLQYQEIARAAIARATGEQS